MQEGYRCITQSVVIQCMMQLFVASPSHRTGLLSGISSAEAVLSLCHMHIHIPVGWELLFKRLTLL